MSTPLELARSFIARGWSPVPVAHKKKRPYLDNWQMLRLDAETAPDHFGDAPQNVGIILGEPSDWLEDVDLDCDEAIVLAPRFLPDTLAFGRASKPRSHLLYRSVGVKTQKHQDMLHQVPDLDANGVQKIGRDGKPKTKAPMLVELRSTGGQTVFPGSTHESGESIEWVDEHAEIAALDANDLAHRVAQLAAASYIKRNAPECLDEYLESPNAIPHGLSDANAAFLSKWLEQAAPTEKQAEPASEPLEAFTKARRHYNADHPLSATKRGSKCPARDCEGQNSYKGDSNKATCFHSSHPTGCGTNCGGSYVFDPLDLAAHNDGKTPKELLRDGGYFKPGVGDLPPGFFDPPDDGAKKAEPAPAKRVKVGGSDPYARFNATVISKKLVPIIDAEHVLLRRDDGSERIYRVNTRNEATPQITSASVDQCLHNALRKDFGPPPQHLLANALRIWKLEGRRISTEPPPFLFSEDPAETLCLRRLDWSPAPGAHPSWDEFTGRLSDPGAFMLFAWSLFEFESQSRQFVWMRGCGEDGKSKVIGVFTDLFGPTASHAIDNSATKETRFLNSAIYGKRLIVYADCKNRRFGMTELVRNWTSGDPVQIEPKGEPPFSAKLNCKLIVASNSRPELTGQNSDMSRMLYIEVRESPVKDDPKWPAKLAEELPAFLDACRALYREKVPHKGKIPLNAESKALCQGAANEFEEEWEDAFEACFIKSDEGRTSGSDFRDALKMHGLDNNDISDFKDWMERKMGIRQHRDEYGRWYDGFILRRA